MSELLDDAPDFGEEKSLAVAPAPANPLAPVEAEVLKISPNMPAADVATIYDRIAYYRQALKALQDRCELLMIEWIKENGDLQISDTARYYVGTPKTTKCVNLPGAIEALLQATGGDFTRFCEILSSNAIKYGAAKKILAPADYAKLFQVEVKETLEEGSAKKLMKADDRFH